ncbi:cytochrome o ubiquinol oxidase subunit III [Ruegeria sediminis]|uniref:Cytochrome o ubiquinol oxidase subunit III n=1 Tax=Ruegeria sediminis TaxID=2583820 RepID=A0ABY2WZN5_9RHOB|nr:cytochrome c oxidase subunit 3 [Ruegeria sediminis]TMV08454.1 cytochrome o ubiquinol oxidase subunit III [Ruegeria sediminis]
MTTAVRHSDSEVSFGFWLYLMSDAILFGLIFATFVVMSTNLAGGPGGTDLFSMTNLSMQTALLLTSSLTVALAHHAAMEERIGPALVWLALTFALGAGFLVLEVRELSGFVASGAGPNRSGYLSAFFTLLSTHGLHVSAGLIWIGTMMMQLLLKGPNSRVLSRLSRLTLFWHFLDIVWIGIFSVVYLPELF